jgi:multidrug efflux system membrane fusion protein
MADSAAAQSAGGERGRGGREGGRGGGARGGAGGAVVVTTSTAVEKPMAVDVRAVGNVEAASTVDIRPQVSGQLLNVNFTEGQEVTAGQLLFTIDPRPFEVALRQAEAALARDTAQSKGIAAQLGRSEELLKQQLTARSDRDALATQYAMSQASIALDTAQVESAKLQLQYTKITSPVSGRTGAVLVHPGSLVRTNDTAPLVVINQLSPAFVSFTVPSRLLAEIRRAQARGLKVTAAPSGSATGGVTGTVTFVDNAIDPGSDTVRLKATFANGNRALWPGQFVDVTLQLAVHPRAVVVPVAAVQAGQQGQFVFVVKADSTVDVRPVKVGWIDGNDVVVESGVAAGDVVVTDGQLRLVPGARVSVRPAPGQSGSAS